MKKYSVEEMDKMRKLIIEIYESEPNTDNYSLGYPGETNWVKRVEERLRTFMLNGTLIKELEDRIIELKKEKIIKEKEFEEKITKIKNKYKNL